MAPIGFCKVYPWRTRRITVETRGFCWKHRGLTKHRFVLTRGEPVYRIPVATRREPVEIYGFWTSRNRLKLEGKMIICFCEIKKFSLPKKAQFSCFELPRWEKRMFQFLSLHIANCYKVIVVCISKAQKILDVVQLRIGVLFLAVALRVTVDT